MGFGAAEIPATFSLAFQEWIFACIKRGDATEFRVPRVTVMLEEVFQQVVFSAAKSLRGNFKFCALVLAAEVIVDGFDNFDHPAGTCEILRNDGAAESGTLVRYECRVRDVSRDRGNDDSTFFDQERSVFKTPFRVVVQELARLQERPVEGVVHHKVVPAGFHLPFVR